MNKFKYYSALYTAYVLIWPYLLVLGLLKISLNALEWAYTKWLNLLN